MTGRIRVAHIIDSLGYGGAEQALLNLTKGFSAQNTDVVVIPLFGNGPMRKDFVNANIEVADIQFGYKWNLFKNTFLLSRYLRRQNIQIAHAHLIFSGIYTGLTKLFGLSVVRIITLHNLAYAPGCNPRNLSYFVRKTLNRFVLRSCFDRIIAVSGAVSEHYQTQFGLHCRPMDTIPNGIPVDGYNTGDWKQKTQSRITDLVAVGRLVPEKGYEILLSAFARLDQGAEEKRLRLTIVGGGPLEAPLKALTEQLQISDLVRFTGALSHENAMQELSQADIYVLPSIFEGFGIAVVEAALMEKPILATRVGGVVDILDEKTAFLVEPSDIDALIDGFNRMLRIPGDAYPEMTGALKSRVIERFSLSSVVRKIERLYSLELKN